LAVLATDGAVFDDGQVYFRDQGAFYSLSVLQPGPRQPLTRVVNATLVLAVRDAYLYWLTSNTETSIRRARRDGSSVAETISDDVRFSSFHDFGVATDATSIYWTNNVLAGSIHRCPLVGCSGASEVVVALLRTPQSLLIDGSELYYQHEAKPDEYSLSRCSLPACAQSSPLVEQLTAPGAFALDAQYLYVATSEQAVSPYNEEQEIVARIRRLPKTNQELP
jgi:hypothetical protein